MAHIDALVLALHPDPKVRGAVAVVTRRGFLQAMFAAAAAPAIVRAESLMRIAPPVFMGVDFTAGPDQTVLVPDWGRGIVGHNEVIDKQTIRNQVMADLVRWFQTREDLLMQQFKPGLK